MPELAWGENSYTVNAGDVIFLARSADLIAFESIMGATIDPRLGQCDPEMLADEEVQAARGTWAGKIALHNLILPKGVNGQLQDIRVQAQQDPYDEMARAKANRAVTFYKTDQPFQYGKYGPQAASRLIGFDLLATARSSARPGSQLIKTSVWYGPVMVDNGKGQLATIDYAGKSFRRAVLKPVARPLRETSYPPVDEKQRIAFASLKTALGI
jgi:hypothetical protein